MMGFRGLRGKQRDGHRVPAGNEGAQTQRGRRRGRYRG